MSDRGKRRRLSGEDNEAAEGQGPSKRFHPSASSRGGVEAQMSGESGDAGPAPRSPPQTSEMETGRYSVMYTKQNREDTYTLQRPDQYVQAARNGLDGSGIFSREDSVWMQRIKSALGKLKVRQIRKATPRIKFTDEQVEDEEQADARSFDAQIIRALLEGSRQPGRNFVLLKSETTTKKYGEAARKGPPQFWGFIVQDTVTKEKRVFGSRILTIFDAPTSAQADPVGHDCATLCNNWPLTLDLISNAVNAKGIAVLRYSTMTKFVDYALAKKHFGQEIRTFASPVSGSTTQPDGKISENMTLNIHGCNPTTHKYYQKAVQVTFQSFTPVQDFELPSGLRFIHGKTGQSGDPTSEIYEETPLGNGKSQYESVWEDDEEDLDKKRALEKALRLASIRLSGLIMTSQQISEEVTRSISHIAARKQKRRTGPYDGGLLFRIADASGPRETVILPSKAAADDLGYMQSFTLPTRDKYRAALCVEAGHAAFEKDSDVIAAYLRVAAAVEHHLYELRVGIPARPRDTLSNAQKQCTYTPCGSCLASVLWIHLRYSSSGFPVCKGCFERERNTVGAGIEMYAKKLSRCHTGREYDHKPTRVKVEAEIDKLFRRKFAKLEQQKASKASWKDYYTNHPDKLEQMVFDETKPSREAAYKGLSIESPFPYFVDDAGTVGIHRADNLLPFTRLSTNLLKHIQLPRFLTVLAQYLTDMESAIKDNDARRCLDLQKNFIRWSKRLRTARIKFGFTKAARIARKTNKQEFEYDKNQSRTGLLRPGDEDPNRPWNKTDSRGARSDNWPPATLKRMAKLQKQLVQVFELEGGVRFSPDGFMYFTFPSGLPKGFDSKDAFALACQRWQRMDDNCNWDEDTEDEPEGLYIEIVFQFCIRYSDPGAKQGIPAELISAMRTRYREFLRLPLVLQTHNPCMLALGHSEHGRRMFSGWSLEPSVLKDRDDNKNNLLVETQASNFYKHCFPHKVYNRMYWRVLKPCMSQRWVDVTTRSLDRTDKYEANVSNVEATEGLKFDDFLPTAYNPGDDEEKQKDPSESESEEEEEGGDDDDDDNNDDDDDNSEESDEDEDDDEGGDEDEDEDEGGPVNRGSWRQPQTRRNLRSKESYPSDNGSRAKFPRAAKDAQLAAKSSRELRDIGSNILQIRRWSLDDDDEDALSKQDVARIMRFVTQFFLRCRDLYLIHPSQNLIDGADFVSQAVEEFEVLPDGQSLWTYVEQQERRQRSA